MFRLPPTEPDSEGRSLEGTDDDNPVVLEGDTPEQFKSLLWALYAL